MKFNIFGALIGLFILGSSCEKVVDIDLNDANPKPVFEAKIEKDSTCYVKATWTSSYYDNSTSPLIENATINIAVENGANENLTYLGNGIYRGSSLVGIANNTYNLTIGLDGKTYTSSSTMPAFTPIDSLTFKKTTTFGGMVAYLVYINYNDPANISNFYAKETNIGTGVSRIDYYDILTDELSDGITTRTLAAGPRFFISGDTLQVKWASIDKATHLYFKTLEDALSGAGIAGAAPANPTTNIEGGALGYFGAWSQDTAVIIIP